MVWKLKGAVALVTVGLCIGVGTAKHSTEPEQVHLSYGENEAELFVTWVTHSPTTASPAVQYGVQNINELTTVGNSTKFVDGGWKQRTIYIHRVTLVGLKPNTNYVYRCGGEEGWSNTFWFETMPSGTNWSPRLNIYGDMGWENAVSVPRIQKDAQGHAIDAVIHVGDFAYDMHDKNGKIGDKFMRMIEPIAAHVPYMVCPGNHEKEYNFSHYRNRFTMPGHSENLFYSFNMGPVHIISINTEAYWYLEYGMKLVVKQYNWLIKDLEEANKNRAERPWIVVYGHRPMYCSGESKECTEDPPTRSGLNGKLFGLEKLLWKYGVDLTFWGHQHNYERFWPVYDYTVLNGTSSPYVDPKAPIHIITGSAGCKEDIEPFNHAVPASALRNTNYGVTEVHFLNATHVTLSQVATDIDDQIVDHIVVVKNHHGPYTRI
uniref:Purple acid phosphatase n=1 Tax=Lygus hesperus TaxID=30085 RepID=A0A146LGJ9_LYGHE